MNNKEVPMECYHEKLIQEHSLKLIAVEKELNYKKERLDSLKDDNIRMDKKLDEIKEIVNSMIITSKEDDGTIKRLVDKQNQRITALETTNKNLKWGIGVGFTAITTAIGLLTFVITYIH